MYSDILYIRIRKIGLVHFWGSNFEFQYFWGFPKNEYFWGIKNLRIFFGVIKN